MAQEGGPIIAACDLGTGGAKTSLYRADGSCLADAFIPYHTRFPQVGFHEQDPREWWSAVLSSIRLVLEKSGVNPGDVRAVGLSGHSLGAVPLGRHGELLSNSVPIWSDGRATAEAAQYFSRFDEHDWYMRTGNGFPPHLYSVFKLMWIKGNNPELFDAVSVFVGTKDYINYRLTGQIFTDPSYASGSGVWNLAEWDFDEELLEFSGFDRSIFARIAPSHEVIGTLTRDAAVATGLDPDVAVVAGGVDNSCMALGARNSRPGRIYNSLGSSSWLAVTSREPVLDAGVRPFVFAHVVPELYTSAVSIFSAGSSFRWVRDTICQDMAHKAETSNKNVYDLMTGLAETSVPGANGLIFNPSLAGGTSLDDSADIRGGWIGLDLTHTRADLIRSAMEGVAMGLELALQELRGLVDLENEITVVGGGSNSALWRQIFADVYGTRIVKTNIDDQAAALGAAALAAVGSGIWPDLAQVDEVHQVEAVNQPNAKSAQTYASLKPIYKEVCHDLAKTASGLVAFRRGNEGGET